MKESNPRGRQPDGVGAVASTTNLETVETKQPKKALRPTASLHVHVVCFSSHCYAWKYVWWIR